MPEQIQSEPQAFLCIEVGPEFALIDPRDFEVVSRRKWVLTRGGRNKYAITNLRQADNKRSIAMHRLILGAPDGSIVDHINGNGLDNRRSNLRLCSNRENIRNQRPRVDTTSPFKGVWFNKNRWQVAIEQNEERLHLGCFNFEHDAARQYDRAARVLFGAFARTNEQEGLYERFPNRPSGVVGESIRGSRVLGRGVAGGRAAAAPAFGAA